MPNLGWAFTYRGDHLTIVKPLLLNFYYDAYFKRPDFIFRSSRSELKEKEYFQKFINEKQKREIIAEKITTPFLENFSSAKLLYDSITQNTNIKSSFEYYFSPSDKNARFDPNKKFGIFVRNKNYENNLIAFNKIGLIMNDSNKNLLLAGVEINQTNEAIDFFDKQIRLYNKQKGDAEKFSFTRDENLIYAPFLCWAYRNEKLNENGQKQENSFSIAGRTEYSKDIMNYKICGQYLHSFGNIFDLITKVKYKRLEMKKLNPLEEAMFSRRRVII